MNLMIIYDFQVYFKRGGNFYQCLALSSGCIDWCIKYQLLDPFDNYFVSLCLCHEHTRRDAMIINRDGFFQRSLAMHTRKYQKRPFLPKLNTVVVLYVAKSCICE